MDLASLVGRLNAEERAAYVALVAEARASTPDPGALRRRVARLVTGVLQRLGEAPDPGPVLRAFVAQHLARGASPDAPPLRELVRRLPYPLALKLGLLLDERDRGAEPGTEPQLPYHICATMGLLVRLAAVLGIQSYVHVAQASDAAINCRVMEVLRAPSDGAWRELAVLLTSALEGRADAPLARRTRAALQAGVHVRGVPNVDAALRELVAYRNRLIHGERVSAADTDRALDLLLATAAAFGFLAEYELFVRHYGKTYRLTGVLPEATDAAPESLPEDEPCLVHRDHAEPTLSLAPLLVFREGTPHGAVAFDELFFLNAGAAERLSYIAYRYARQLDGRELGAYAAFRRFMRAIPTPPIPPDPRIDFGGLVEEHGRLFVGRDDVLAELDAFVGERPSAYGVVTALGGIGKTALFSRLYARHGALPATAAVRGNRWIFHFCAPVGGRDSAVVALRSLIAQLCDHLGLDRGPHLSSNLEALQRAFATLLDEAGRHLASGERLVVVVDALDEGLAESAGTGVIAALPTVVPAHVVVLVSYRVDDEGRNTRVEEQLAHIPERDRTPLRHANPMGGLTREDVVAFLGRVAGGLTVPESTVQAVWAAAASGGGADPFYLRAVADGVEGGRIELARAETVPASLDDAFDELWMRLPTDRDFLLHRILGLLAIMRDYGDDDLFAALLAEVPAGAEPLTALEVTALRARAGKLLVYDGDLYGLIHDRFRRYLVGEEDLIAAARAV